MLSFLLQYEQTVYLILAAISTAALSIFISALWKNLIYAFVKILRGGRNPVGRIPSRRHPAVWIGFVFFLLLTVSSSTLATINTPHQTIPVSNRNYVQVDLSPWANWSDFPSYHLIRPLTGPVILDSIPFSIPLPDIGVIQTQNIALVGEHTIVNIPVDIENARYIHILLNGGYVENKFQAIPVGILSFTFGDGTTIRTPIIAGQCLREGWYFTDDSANTMITKIDEVGECEMVFAEVQSRDGDPAVAVIDKMTIPIPEQVNSLKEITIEDTSTDTVGSLNPSIIIIAITVQLN